MEEAATDVIAAAQARGTAEPWTDPYFIDAIAHLQKERLIRGSYHPHDIQFHDRSIICTAALAFYLGYSYSTFLSSEVERVRKEQLFENRVFFLRNLGFVKPTQARRISLEEAVRFERIHEETYRRFGFQLVLVEPGGLSERVDAIKAAIA